MLEDTPRMTIAVVVSTDDASDDETPVALVPDLTVAVIGTSVVESIRWRRERLQLRDTILVLGPGLAIVVPVFRNPGEGSIMRSVAVHGRGALNVDACRTPGPGWTFEHGAKTGRTGGGMMGPSMARVGTAQEHEGGRWPTNLVFVHHEACAERACNPTCPVHTMRRYIDDSTDKADAPSTYAFPRMATVDDVVQWVQALVGLGAAPSPDREFLAARSSYLDGRHDADTLRRENESIAADIATWLDEAEVEDAASNHRVGRPIG